MFNRHADIEPTLAELAEQSVEVKIVKRMLKKQGNSDNSLSEEEEDCVQTAIVDVSGAGIPEVNGEYTFSRISRDAGCYTKQGIWQGAPVDFSIYKFKVTSQPCGEDSQWFISASPSGADLGGKDDIDFYYAINDREALHEGRILPPVQFIIDAKYREARSPPPKVYSRYSPLESLTISFGQSSLNSSRIESDSETDDLNDE